MSGFDTSQPITNKEVLKNVDTGEESSEAKKSEDAVCDDLDDAPER